MKSHHALFALVPYSVALAVAEDFYTSSLFPRFPQGSLASTDGRCGASFGNAICTGTEYGDCCSQKSFCGSSSAHCQEGCQSGFGSCEKAGGQSTSTSGNCGISGGFTLTCVGSQWGDCCSSGGFCGETSAYCGNGCNPLYGKCSGSANTPAKPTTTKASLPTAKPVQEAPLPSPQSEPQSDTKVQPVPKPTSQVETTSTKTTAVAPLAPSSTGESSSLPPSKSPSATLGSILPTSSVANTIVEVSAKTSELPPSSPSTLLPTTSSSRLTPTDPASSRQSSSSSAIPSSVHSTSLTPGAKAGIAVGAVAALVAVFGLLMFFLRKRRLAAKETDPPQYSAEVYDYKATAKLENEKNNYYEMDSRKPFNPNVAELPMSPEEEAAAKERARIARMEDRVAAGYDGAYRGN